MKLFSTFLKDLKLSFRNYYIYIEIIMTIVFVAVLLFVVPENFQAEAKMYIHLDVDRAVLEQLSQQLPLDDVQSRELSLLLEADLSGATDPAEQFEDWPNGLFLMPSADAVRANLAENRDAIGMVLSMTDGTLQFEFILQGYESQSMRNLLEKQFTAPLLAMMPDTIDQTQVTLLSDSTEKLPDRVNLLPLLLVLNSAFVGLFIIAAYLFMDKEEGTIKALAVTPAHVWQYLLSKVGVMLVTGLITGSLIVLSVGHAHVHFGHFLVLLAIFNLFGSALGLFIASFFDTLTKSLGTLYLVIIFLSLASWSYFMPAFSPRVITWLPTYPMLFAMRETLLQQPDLGYIYTWAGVFALISVALFLLANLRYKKTITI